MKKEAFDKLQKYCEKALEEVEGFNHYGLYFNFLTPEVIKHYLCENGKSYWDEKVVFCSEFLTRALCHIGVFVHINNLWQDEQIEDDLPKIPTKSPNININIKLGECLRPFVDSRGRVLVDAAMTSPNMLYIYLIVRKYMCHTNSGPTNLDSDPFYGKSLFHITDVLVPVNTAPPMDYFEVDDMI